MRNKQDSLPFACLSKDPPQVWWVTYLPVFDLPIACQLTYLPLTPWGWILTHCLPPGDVWWLTYPRGKTCIPLTPRVFTYLPPKRWLTHGEMTYIPIHLPGRCRELPTPTGVTYLPHHPLVCNELPIPLRVTILPITTWGGDLSTLTLGLLAYLPTEEWLTYPLASWGCVVTYLSLGKWLTHPSSPGCFDLPICRRWLTYLKGKWLTYQFTCWGLVTDLPQEFNDLPRQVITYPTPI